MMNDELFTRAKPRCLEIEEVYEYEANISGNPTIEEKGKPTGTISLELPLDGYEFFSRLAYKDIEKFYSESDESKSAKFGYIVVEGIDAEKTDFLAGEELERPSLPLMIKLPENPNDLNQLLSDEKKITFEHVYHPEWPEVYPKPRILSLKVNIFDEDYMDSDKKNWVSLTQDSHFARSLSIVFGIEVAIPETDKATKIKVNKMQLEWPVATSYHMLQLWVGGKKKKLNYISNLGRVEWRDIELDEKPAETSQVAEGSKLFRSKEIKLIINEPGEFYQKEELKCDLEIQVDHLLSNMTAKVFNAQGFSQNISKVKRRSLIKADMKINLLQRFARKIYTPHQRLQFEGVILEEARIRDIKNLLKDNGFNITHEEDLSKGEKNPGYYISGRKKEGTDDLEIFIVAQGNIAPTERETIIPGGKTFKTMVRSGNTVLDIQTDLRGNINKLMQVMNTLHIALKERFRHVSTID